MTEAFAECDGDLYVTSPLTAGQKGEITISRSSSDYYVDANGKTWKIAFNGFTGAGTDVTFTDIKPDFLASGVWLVEETFIMPAHDLNLVAHFTLVPAQ
jgi:hypothetical protein